MLIKCELSYSVRDPFAVSLILNSDGDHPVRWVFSRELLAEGLSRPAGEGDVTVWPEISSSERELVWLELGRFPHTALFTVHAGLVAGWLAETYLLVARGEEATHVDWGPLTLAD